VEVNSLMISADSFGKMASNRAEEIVMRRTCLLVTGLFVLVFGALPARGASFWEYLRGYQLGLEYSGTAADVRFTYTAPAPDASQSLGTCSFAQGDTTQECSLTVHTGAVSGWSLILDQPIRRTGFWYLGYDVAFGARLWKGSYEEDSMGVDQPLKKVDYTLAGGVLKPYIRAGMTPQLFPELLFTFGPVFQVLTGTVSLNDEAKPITAFNMADSIGGFLFGQFGWDLIFLRFGQGKLGHVSLFYLRESVSDAGATDIYPGTVDGMENIKAEFYQTTFGLRVLTTFL
jgi:hypothetical protein